MSTLPRRPRGRLSAAKEAVYYAQVSDFCETINAIRETLDFKVSSRGWCYILEEKIGLLKGEANARVVRPDAGRELQEKLRSVQVEVQRHVLEMLEDAA